MPFRRPDEPTSRRGRYFVAIAAAALAAGLRVLLSLTVEPRPPMLVLSMGAIGTSAWFGGLGPGLLATGLCSFLDLCFVDPNFSVDVEHASDLIDVGIFLVVGVGVVWGCESLHRARQDLGRAMQRAELASDRERETMIEAERRKDEFIAVLAHELRNPLAPLRHTTAVLRRISRPSAEEARCLDVLDRQIHQMTRLLDDLLDVSRISRGKLELHRQRIGLTSALRPAIDSVEPLIAAKRHTLAVSLPPAEVALDADPVRLLQIFANLLTNAAKYTDPGGRIAVRVTPHERDVEIVMTDTGIGIEASHMPHLFEPFTQSAAARARSEGGLGLGLGLARRLIEMHGGSIAAHSAGPGRGSEFTIRLPRAPPDGQSSGAPPDAPGDMRALRVLIADDNVDAADSMAILLQLDGCDVRTAHDGEAAVREAAEFRPRVVFLDLGMPKMDGFEACRAIRAEPWGRTMTLVALTGWGQDRDRTRCVAAGFDHHVTKPADPQFVSELLAAARDRAG